MTYFVKCFCFCFYLMLVAWLYVYAVCFNLPSPHWLLFCLLWLCLLCARICSFISFTVLFNYEPFLKQVYCVLSFGISFFSRVFFVVVHALFPSLVLTKLLSSDNQWEMEGAKEMFVTDVFLEPAIFILSSAFNRIFHSYTHTMKREKRAYHVLVLTSL